MRTGRLRGISKPLGLICLCLVLSLASKLSQAATSIPPLGKKCTAVPAVTGLREICTYTFPLKNPNSNFERNKISVEVIKSIAPPSFTNETDPRGLSFEEYKTFIAEENADSLKLAQGLPSAKDDDGWLITDEGPWSSLVNREKFNCHSYAFSIKFGFGPDESVPGNFTVLAADGFQTLIKNQCTETFQYEFKQSPPSSWPFSYFDEDMWELFFEEAEGKLRQGQIAVLESLGEYSSWLSDTPHREYIHSGVLIWRKGYWFLKSKIGQGGPLLAMPLQDLFNFYPLSAYIDQKLILHVFDCNGL